jgi:hypothetical protein
MPRNSTKNAVLRIPSLDRSSFSLPMPLPRKEEGTSRQERWWEGKDRNGNRNRNRNMKGRKKYLKSWYIGETSITITARVLAGSRQEYWEEYLQEQWQEGNKSTGGSWEEYWQEH